MRSGSCLVDLSSTSPRSSSSRTISAIISSSGDEAPVADLHLGLLGQVVLVLVAARLPGDLPIGPVGPCAMPPDSRGHRIAPRPSCRGASNIRHHIGFSSRRWNSTSQPMSWSSPPVAELRFLAAESTLHQPIGERLRGNTLGRRRGRLGPQADRRHVRDAALALPLQQPAPETEDRLAVHAVVVADALEHGRLGPLPRLPAVDPALVLDDRAAGGEDGAGALRRGRGARSP